MIRDIGIIGTGGVGGYFGAKLCGLQQQASGIRIHCLARGAHLEHIRKDGLILHAKGEPEIGVRPYRITDRIQEMGALDLVLICVKEFDLDQTLRDLCASIHDQTYILPLLNGVNVASRVRRIVDKGCLLPACVYIGTHIESPGVIRQAGGACKIFFGPETDRSAAAPDDLLRLFQDGQIKHAWRPDIQKDIWEKFIFIAGYGLVTATHDVTLGDVLQDASLKSKVRQVMQEAVALAQASGVSLDPGMVELALSKGNQFPPETKTSFQRDFEQAHKPDERQLFAGTMVSMGRELGVETPCTDHLFRMLNERKPSFWT